LFKSAERFKSFPDYLQVWPAHGAGSACGKGLGAIPSSTVGYEKLCNPALQFTDEDDFVRYILADQPEAPKYFAVMKRVNKEGPRILGAGHHHSMLDVAGIENAVKSGTVVDLTPSSEYAKAHVPGTINIPLGMLAVWAGWLVDYDRPTYLICEPGQLEEAARLLHKIGVEDIAGAFDASEVRSSGLATEVYSTGTPQDLSHSIEAGEVKLLDVRSNDEWKEGHIAQAEHRFLGRLPKYLGQLPSDEKFVVQCRSGARSAIAASVLQAAGFKNVVNLTGGYVSWKSAGLPSVKSQPAMSS
jgi:hydroxyacylglutathione hydrolase